MPVPAEHTVDATPIYAPDGELLAMVIRGSVWFPEDLRLFYPDLQVLTTLDPAEAD